MRSFLKLVFTSCLGSILAIFFLFIIILTIGLISSSGKNNIPKDAVLLLNFDGLLPERTNNVSQNNQFNFSPKNALGTYHIVELIKNAATDDRISQIVIKSENSQMGFVSMRHLAEALDYCRENCDKPIYAYGDFFTQSGYILASEADSVFLNPQGGIDLRGFGVMKSFNKELLDKLGIKMNVFYAGDFKSAAEAYYRNDMSENSKTQTREYLSSLHNSFVDLILENRNIDKAVLSNGMNEFKFSNADSTLSKGVVDGLMQWFEFEDKLRDNLGLKKGKKINYINLAEYDKKTKIKKKENKSKDKIAVVYAEGEIRYGEEIDGVINEITYHKIFDKIKSNEDIKAMVIRVNSPGGSSYTSEAILQEISHMQADGLPVIASFGNYAASGGYYIACQADTIVAEENTLTGSIGAFSVFPDVSNLMEEKLGIHFDTVKTGKFAASFSPTLALQDQEKDIIRNSNTRIYNTFIGRVAEGRNMSIEEVEKIAQGRVWIGMKAKELNLVDEIGNLEDAINIAAEKAGLETYSIREYPYIQTPPWVEFLEAFSQDNSTSLGIQDNEIAKELLGLKSQLQFYTESKSPLVLMPFKILF